MSTLDPAAYLRAIAPFAELPRAVFDEAARSVEVVFHPAGAILARPGGDRLHHLYVIRKGSVRLERDGRSFQFLEEGEIFGYTSLLKKEATIEVVVEEDLVAYRLPETAFARLLSEARFAGHFAARVAQRLQATISRTDIPIARPDLAVAVERIGRRAPVWVDPDLAVGEAARMMRRQRISSLLVRTDPPGIVTDRDLRGRVLAEARGPSTPVREVCTSPLHTVPAETPVHAAWASLLDAGVHHLPLVRGGEIVGIVTSTDFLRHTAPGPVSVLRSVERLASPADLPGYAAQVADMAASLVASGLDALVIAGFVARLNDALLRRLLSWAEADLGAPPAPYAWIVFGSEGRMEQTLLTDQDNALVYADEGEPSRAWFQALGERVNADLERAGFPSCPGGYMARSWNGPLHEWSERFRGWIDVPNPKALLVASIFFDFRRVGGTLDLEPLEELLAGAREKGPFLRLLAASSMEYHPPPGFLLRLRGESSTIDVKAHGVSPIVFLARCYGLEAGTRARSTLERLEAAVAAGLVEEEQRAGVVDAFRFVLALRLRMQLARQGTPDAERGSAAGTDPEAGARGAAVTTKIPLSDLSAIERTRLKEAFRAVEAWHDHARQHFHTAS
jgi:CBS domain-containing protein